MRLQTHDGKVAGLPAMTLAMFLTVAAHAQSPRPPTGGGSRIVSPAVVATTIARLLPSGKGSLDVLILWRGAPGWFVSERTGTAMWGGAADSPNADSGSSDVVHHTLSFGNHSFALRFDRQAHSVRIQETEVMLQDVNVVLVDDVDSQAGPRVVGTLSVPTQMDWPPLRVDTLIRSSPEALAFLRCDTTLPDAAVQIVVERIVCQSPMR